MPGWRLGAPWNALLLLRRAERVDVDDQVLDVGRLDLPGLAPCHHARWSLPVSDAVAEVRVGRALGVVPDLRVLPVGGRIPGQLDAARAVGLVAGNAFDREDLL